MSRLNHLSQLRSSLRPPRHPMMMTTMMLLMMTMTLSHCFRRMRPLRLLARLQLQLALLGPLQTRAFQTVAS